MTSFATTNKNVKRMNKRMPVKLDREQYKLAKKMRKCAPDSMKALEFIYDYLDRFFSYSDGLVACKKGCSHCCHMRVAIVQVESDYIHRKTGASVKRLELDSYVDEGPWIDANRPCPFLKDDVCSIYEFRPMVCRTHVNFEDTNEVCRPDVKYESVPLFDRDASLPGAMKAFSELASGYGGGAGDIREFFGNKPKYNPSLPGLGDNS